MADLYKPGSYSIEINDQCVPKPASDVRTVKDDAVVPAYYPRPPLAHSHHLQGGDPDVSMATWGFNEQARLLEQEDRNSDETLKVSKKR